MDRRRNGLRSVNAKKWHEDQKRLFNTLYYKAAAEQTARKRESEIEHLNRQISEREKSEKELLEMHVVEVHPPDRRNEAAEIVQKMLAGEADHE